MQVNLSSFSTNKMISLFFRLSAMGSKFVMFTFLSKYFDEPTYGTYTLLATMVTVAIFLLGFDFYNYLIRDILVTKNEIASKIYSSFVLYIFVYVFFSIVGYLVFKKIDYFSQYAGLLLIICITEHLNQEIYRLLIAFKKVYLANWYLFFRVAGWTIWVLFQIIYLNQNPSLNEILLTWALFNFITLIFVFLKFFKTIKTQIFLIKVNKKWLLKGIKISLVFYLATIALKIVEYSNRFIVEDVLDTVSAGIFSFYSNFSMITGIYVSTIVVSYELPDLIESSTSENFKTKLMRFKKLLWQHSFIATLSVLLIIYPVLLWQGKSTFISYWPLILLLSLGMFFMNISLIYHSYLYIWHREMRLLKIVLWCSVVNVVLTYLLSFYLGLYGAGFAFLITAILMFILRKTSISKKEIEI
ncbi:MAG: polysaccharide biosynthesis C-terminal domain-containing protein [Flavobacteriaceae bacterium]